MIIFNEGLDMAEKKKEMDNIYVWLKNLMDKEQEMEIQYPLNAASAVIVSNATDVAGINLEDEEIETLIASLDRGKRTKRGFELKVGIPKIAEFKFKIPPEKEILVVHKIKKKKRK